MGWDDLVRVGVGKSSSHYVSQCEKGVISPVTNTYALPLCTPVVQRLRLSQEPKRVFGGNRRSFLPYHLVMDAPLRLPRLLRATGIGFLCLFLVGCQYDPWADRFLKNRPAETNLVGTYRVDADTLARRISIPWSSKTISIDRDAEITLYADHKAQFLHVPELDVFTRQECVISGIGLWQLGRNDHYVDVAVQIQRTDYHQSVDGC